jgi:hypothetical protein
MTAVWRFVGLAKKGNWSFKTLQKESAGNLIIALSVKVAIHEASSHADIARNTIVTGADPKRISIAASCAQWRDARD